MHAHFLIKVFFISFSGRWTNFSFFGNSFWKALNYIFI